ncbi:MAG TPA: M67 family metallopeptidase [Vicinamibacterales bacterium]|nr:M67 family metallopeptidase [Vicinamibacterales bacterium]
MLDSIISHARDEAPNECCGLLVAAGGLIEQSIRTTNLEASPTRYRVDPAQHFALIRSLRGTPRHIAGAYHSHPHSSAALSPTDIAEAFDPDLVYLVVSLEDSERPEVRAYQVRAGAAAEIRLVPEP